MFSYQQFQSLSAPLFFRLDSLDRIPKNQQYLLLGSQDIFLDFFLSIHQSMLLSAHKSCEEEFLLKVQQRYLQRPALTAKGILREELQVRAFFHHRRVATQSSSHYKLLPVQILIGEPQYNEEQPRYRLCAHRPSFLVCLV